MEVKCDRVGDGRSNFLNDASARVSAVSDDHDLHRTPDVPQIKDCLRQVHFFPCGNDHRCVKDFSPDFINRPVPIAYFCKDASGSSETFFHFLTTPRTDQQSLVKPTRQTDDRTNDAHGSAR